MLSSRPCSTLPTIPCRGCGNGKPEGYAGVLAGQDRIDGRTAGRHGGHLPSGGCLQAGLTAGLELVQDKTAQKSFPMERRIGHCVILEVRKLRAILRPLRITLGELKELHRITFQVIHRDAVRD